MKLLFQSIILLCCVSCASMDWMGLFSEDNKRSIYNKNVDFGIVPNNFYLGRNEDYSFGNANTSTKDIYGQFDSLVLEQYLSKESIGFASDGTEMYMYQYTSLVPDFYGSAANKRNKTKLKIIVICGQHGFEKSSIYGTLFFIKDICHKYSNDPVLKYFHQYVDLIIIPCANPYGIDNNVTINANGVNLNRNWPVRDWEQNEDSIIGTTKYAGNSGGDQPEVQNIMSILKNHSNALLILDFHTKGAGIQTKESINWLSMVLPDDAYRDLLVEIGNYHICNITSAFEYLYAEEIGNSESMCGYLEASSVYSTTGYLSTYAAQQGFLSVTFEGFNGFPTDITPFQDNVKKANSELLGNYLITMCYVLSKYQASL